MLKELSIFTASEDIELALGLLWRTATGIERTADNSAPLAELADWYGSLSGQSALEKLAERMNLAVEFPSVDEIHQLFKDELLSSRLKTGTAPAQDAAIRQALAAAGEWEAALQPEVAALVHRYGGPERLRSLAPK